LDICREADKYPEIDNELATLFKLIFGLKNTCSDKDALEFCITGKNNGGAGLIFPYANLNLAHHA